MRVTFFGKSNVSALVPLGNIVSPPSRCFPSKSTWSPCVGAPFRRRIDVRGSNQSADRISDQYRGKICMPSPFGSGAGRGNSIFDIF